MGKKEITSAVLTAYKERYPKWTEVRVTEIVLDVFGGHLAVINAITETNEFNSELCYVYPDLTVRIFSETEALAAYLEQKARLPILERLFTRPILSGVVFLFLLVAIFVTGFYKEAYSSTALSILGSVVGVAAGFFFGSNSDRN